MYPLLLSRLHQYHVKLPSAFLFVLAAQGSHSKEFIDIVSSAQHWIIGMGVNPHGCSLFTNYAGSLKIETFQSSDAMSRSSSHRPCTNRRIHHPIHHAEVT